MQVVLVLGVGRSGTTLMQRVLNTMPSTNVCGENRHAWLHMARFLDRMFRLRTDSREQYDQHQGHFWYAWYNVADKSALVQQVRQLFETAYQAERWRRIGFKEIRMGQGGYEELEAELEFFRLLYPDVRIIFNLRDIDAISRSQQQVSGKPPAQASAQFGDPAVQRLYQRYAQEHGGFVWHYEDWHREHKVKELYAYVGEPFSRAYEAALREKTS